MDDNFLNINLKKPVTISYDNQLHLDAVAVKTLEVVESTSGSPKIHCLVCLI